MNQTNQPNEELLTIFEELEGELITFAEARKLVEELLVEARIDTLQTANTFVDSIGRNTSPMGYPVVYVADFYNYYQEKQALLNVQLDGLKGE